MRTYLGALFILTILFGCTKDDTSNEGRYQLEQFSNRILGYHIDGQENLWGMHDIILLNTERDAIVFGDNNSLDIGYIGFQDGKTDLSEFEIVGQSEAVWLYGGDTITIILGSGAVYHWRILEINDEFMIIEQEFTNEQFSLRFMD